MGLARLDSLLREKVVESRWVAGAVLLARVRNEVIFHEAYGYRQTVPDPLSMTKDTLFDLASLTKSLSTGLLTMQLWQKGRIRLEQTLSNVFGPLADPAKCDITVRDLLANRSGLPAWRPYYRQYPASACPVSREEVFQKILSEDLEERPGKREVYSDLGYMMLGWILERVAETSLDKLFQEEIAGPLSLGRSSYRRIRSGRQRGCDEEGPVAATEQCPWRGRVLKGEVHDENSYLLGGVAGHAGLFSTAGEVDRVVVQIFKGVRAGTGFFHQDALNTFFHRPEDLSSGTWALGWDTPSPKGSTSGRHFSGNSYGHTGFTGTSLWMDLDREISVTFLTNRVHPKRDNNALKILRPMVHDVLMEEILSPNLGRKDRGKRAT